MEWHTLIHKRDGQPDFAVGNDFVGDEAVQPAFAEIDADDDADDADEIDHHANRVADVLGLRFKCNSPAPQRLRS